MFLKLINPVLDLWWSTPAAWNHKKCHLYTVIFKACGYWLLSTEYKTWSQMCIQSWVVFYVCKGPFVVWFKHFASANHLWYANFHWMYFTTNQLHILLIPFNVNIFFFLLITMFLLFFLHYSSPRHVCFFSFPSILSYISPSIYNI